MVHLDSDRDIIYMIVEGKLTNQDFDKMGPFLRSRISEYGKIRLYYEMKNFKGWTFFAFWRDLWMDLKYRNNVKKIALVGEKTWEKWLADVIRPLSGAELRFYRDDRKGQARNWIEEAS